MAAMNVLFAVIMSMGFRGSNEHSFIGFAAFCFTLLAVVLVIRIHRTLPRVAAAE